MTALIPSLLTATLGWLATADPGVDPRGSGAWPLSPQPRVVGGFDPPSSAYGAGHRGVDLAGAFGQVVHTALAGQVTYAGNLAGRGVVVVSHGDTRTTYEPVRPTVRVGDLVERGGPLGVLERTQSHCLPRACLHWGWLRGEVYLDPLALVGAGPVRLKPWEGLGPGRDAVVSDAGRAASTGLGAAAVGASGASALPAHLLPAPLHPAATVALHAATLALDRAG